MGEDSFKYVARVPGLNGQEALWQQRPELGLTQNLSSSAKEEWSEGMVQNWVQYIKTLALVSLNVKSLPLKLSSFLLLAKISPGLA